MSTGVSKEMVEKNCIKYDPKVHDPKKMVKIDAMFFTATEEDVKLQPLSQSS